MFAHSIDENGKSTAQLQTYHQPEQNPIVTVKVEKQPKDQLCNRATLDELQRFTTQMEESIYRMPNSCVTHKAGINGREARGRPFVI